MVSVALTTYNGEKYIGSQLDSIVCQTVLPDEIVVFDDCSSDRTVGIVKGYAEKNAQIKCIININESNQGYISKFFNAIKMCAGDIIILCDQDDVWLPEKVELGVSAIAQVDSSSTCVPPPPSSLYSLELYCRRAVEQTSCQ